MRQVGYLANESDAKLFSDYLHAKGIGNEAEATREGTWAIWIHDDSHLDAGREELERFAAEPQNPVYRKQAPRGRAAVVEKQKEDAAFRDRMVDVRTTWVGTRQAGIGWLTAILMGISVIVTLFATVNDPLRYIMYFDNPVAAYGVDSLWFGRTFAALRHGEVWRLITPIFLHASLTGGLGILHILFNMLWLKQLGTAIEVRRGTLYFGAMVLVFAILSNLGQYIVSGPWFGGMSGVVFGLFSYVWIRGKYDPRRPYELDPNTVRFMMVWFLIGFTGILPIANTAHAVGLVSGFIWATITVRRIPFTNIRF